MSIDVDRKGKYQLLRIRSFSRKESKRDQKDKYKKKKERYIKMALNCNCKAPLLKK